MVASKFNLIFSLQLCGAILLCNGMSMTLHTRRSMTPGIRVKEPLVSSENISTSYIFPEYYIKLSVGTPPQDLLLVMDTGSSVVWASCTPNYTCPECPGFTTVFLPNKSSSALPVQCADSKCRDVCEEEVNSGMTCRDKCSGTCPDYNLLYGSAITTGHLLTDTLSLPSRSGQITNFGFGCSVHSQGIAGIAGFGRGNLSLPSQVRTLIGDKFAYCLNDQNNGSMIVLGDKAVPTHMTLNYTPFLNNSLYKEFYYIGLQRVSVGGKSFTLPSNAYTIDGKGNGGTIIDSGTSITLLPEAVLDQISTEFASQIQYPKVELDKSLCYNVSGVANIEFPELAFHFSSGSDMVLPHGNSFMPVTSVTYCLAISNFDSTIGPAAILGNYQQKNLYILYDREMNHLGFTQQACQKFC